MARPRGSGDRYRGERRPWEESDCEEDNAEERLAPQALRTEEDVILLDTNVVSALMSQDLAAIAWLDAQPAESIWLTSITLFETGLGLALMPAGKRRRGLEAAFERLLIEDRDGRVAAFDAHAAKAAAALAAQRRRAGRPVDMRDTQIAGIAIARRATLATRNVRQFEGVASVVNPWG